MVRRSEKKTMTDLVPKIISVRCLLPNGISPEEKLFRVESNQDCYDNLAVGDYVLLPGTIVSVGRVLAINAQEEELILSEWLERIICRVEIDEFKLIEGLEIQ